MTSLWKHQIEGGEWAAATMREHGGAALWWGMRTGKTRAALHAASLVGGRTLVVTPAGDVMRVWRDEAADMGAGRVVVLDAGTVKARSERVGEGDVVVVNYQALWRPGMDKALAKAGFQTVIYDEAQNLKAPQGKASRYAATLAQHIPHRLGLSGTPIPHGPLDAYGVYRAIDAGFRATGLPRTYTQFRLRYTRPAERNEWRDSDIIITSRGRGILDRWKLRDLDDLQRRLYRIADRRLSPPPETPPTETRWEVTLEPSAMRVYRELERDLITEHGGNVVVAANALVKNLRLSQVTGGAVRGDDGELVYVSTAKRDALAEYLSEAAGEPVVVFARFHSDLDAIHDAARIAGVTSMELSGRVKQLAEWKEGEAQVLAVQEQSGGVGLDMTRARLCAYFSLSHSYGDYEQSVARVMGPRQSRPVDYTHFVVTGTVDSDIYRSLEAKTDVIASVIDRLSGLRS